MEANRVWSAYALADLEPPFREQTDWLASDNSVVMIYRGLEPPVLFANGEPAGVRQLFRQVPDGRYLITLTGTFRSLLGGRLIPHSIDKMWRMVLPVDAEIQEPSDDVVGLTPADAEAVLELFDDHPDRPDSFSPPQLESGTFFGVRDGASLIAVAGTHVVSAGQSVAAIGNVFTHPERRGEGHAGRATSAVVQALRRRSIRTVVLNVAMTNQSAIRVYRRMGFMPFCAYYEGTADLISEEEKGTGGTHDEGI